MDTHILTHNDLEHKTKTLKKRKEIRHFLRQEVDLSNTPVFLPEGWEMPLLGIYIIFLPYIAGVLFVFFSVANMDYKTFSSLNDNLFFIMSWLVGYEIIAASILLLIAKSAILFHLKNS
ncbi:MAG TPA: hypothetical protein CFH81_02870 [Sulfurovum sp. UBA12169]|nr:MAG TPA: hypothetical protein CFH81_02870 [Sulfurovum sp. UBA12169]